MKRNEIIIKTSIKGIITNIVLVIFNLLKIVDGPYPFLQIYNQSIIASILWFIAIVGGAACFSLIIRFLNKKFCLVKE